jgi:hypothetical protein
VAMHVVENLQAYSGTHATRDRSVMSLEAVEAGLQAAQRCLDEGCMHAHRRAEDETGDVPRVSMPARRDEAPQ